MKFSIIVPIYKVGKYINQCIESVLNQSCGDFELILVDDGSPDNCPRICDDYALKDGRVKVIHKTNGGLVSARKAGCVVAVGEYIVCLDGDDYIAPNCLDSFAKAIDEYSPDICLCGFYKAYSENEVKCLPFENAGFYDKETIEKHIYPYLIENKYGRYFSASIWAKAFRREIYTEYQTSVDSRIKIGEDQCVVKPCVFRAESLYVIDECLYYYRQNDESMTKSKGVFDLSVPKLIANRFEKEIDVSSFDFQAQIYRHAVHDLFNAAVSQFNGKGGYKVAKRNISNILKDDYYRSVIKKSKFCFLSNGWLARLALRYRWYFLMFLYNKRQSKNELYN